MNENDLKKLGIKPSAYRRRVEIIREMTELKPENVSLDELRRTFKSDHYFFKAMANVGVLKERTNRKYDWAVDGEISPKTLKRIVENEIEIKPKRRKPRNAIADVPTNGITVTIPTQLIKRYAWWCVLFASGYATCELINTFII